MSVDEWDFKVTKIKHPVIDYLKTSGSAELYIEGQLLKGGGFASDRWLPAFYNPFIEDLKETGRLVAKAGKDGSITESEIESIVNRDSYKLFKAWKQDWLKDPKDYHVMAEKFRETNMLVVNYVCEERKIERLSLSSLYHFMQHLNQRTGRTLLYQKLLLGIVAASLLMFAAAGIFVYNKYQEMDENAQRIERMVNYNITEFKKEFDVDKLIEKKILPLFREEKKMTMNEAEERIRAILRAEGITQEGQIETIRTAVFEDERVKGLLRLADQFSGD